MPRGSQCSQLPTCCFIFAGRENKNPTCESEALHYNVWVFVCLKQKLLILLWGEWVYWSQLVNKEGNKQIKLRFPTWNFLFFLCVNLFKKDDKQFVAHQKGQYVSFIWQKSFWFAPVLDIWWKNKMFFIWIKLVFLYQDVVRQLKYITKWSNLLHRWCILLSFDLIWKRESVERVRREIRLCFCASLFSLSAQPLQPFWSEAAKNWLR